uniref:Mucin like 3 n=1 Tax=Lynx canadensis TaxID=61383 RepID=A0A667G9N6_LYNCA
MLWKDGDSDICSLSSQPCHGKGTPFHKYINSKGFLICLFSFTGAITFQELQKTGDSPASDNLLPPTSGFVYSAPPDHTALQSSHSPLDLTKSTEAHNLKRNCNTTHHLKPIYKHIGNSQNSTSHHEVLPTSEKTPSNQGRDPNVRNGRSIDPTDSTNTHKGLSGVKHPTSAPKIKTTCLKFKSDTGTDKSVTSLRNITSESKSATSQKTINPVHNSGNSESKKIPMYSSGKSTTAPSDEVTRTPRRSERAGDHTIAANLRTTVASGTTIMKTTGRINRTSTTRAPGIPTDHGQKIISANSNTTRAPERPKEHGENATPADKKTTRTQAKSIKHGVKATLVTETTKPPRKPKESVGKNTASTETIRPPFNVTGDKSVTNTSPGSNKTDVTHGVPIGSFTLTTSHIELSSIMSEAPGNQNHPYQNKDGSQGGLRAGGMRENDSFPAWAIVIVVLVAVILFLVFLGLIFLIACTMKTHRALVQNTEDNDPEDDGGPNSYPVYLMEQQTLGKGQIPSPR